MVIYAPQDLDAEDERRLRLCVLNGLARLARTPEQLETNLGALGVQLDEAQLARLDEASAIPLGFPHDLLANPGMRKIHSGDMWDSIDRPAATVA